MNSAKAAYKKSHDLVLIDTWWNVNTTIKVQLYADGKVLIDTWWNVNEKPRSTRIYKKDSFNRYMVECEYVCRSWSGPAFYSFNRYMVECELYKAKLRKNGVRVLIDTWWNVNERGVNRGSAA